MRIAVTGTTGRVGAALARHLAARHEVIPLPRSRCDLADKDRLAAALDDLDCDVFLNPAGITSLEACEDDPAAAFRINAEAPEEIADWAATHEVRLIHFSTDYVFDGEVPGLRTETDPTAPLSVYGCSKLAGEMAVLAFPQHAVVRVSWVFGPEKRSFVDQVYDNALDGKPLAAIADKFSLPAFTADIAGWTECLVDHPAAGIFHACNSGDPISWHHLATATVAEMAALGLIPDTPPVATELLAEKAIFRARRPRFTGMATGRLAALLGHPPRNWESALADHLRLRALSR